MLASAPTWVGTVSDFQRWMERHLTLGSAPPAVRDEALVRWADTYLDLDGAWLGTGGTLAWYVYIISYCLVFIPYFMYT